MADFLCFLAGRFFAGVAAVPDVLAVLFLWDVFLRSEFLDPGTPVVVLLSRPVDAPAFLPRRFGFSGRPEASVAGPDDFLNRFGFEEVEPRESLPPDFGSPPPALLRGGFRRDRRGCRLRASAADALAAFASFAAFRPPSDGMV